VLQTRKKNIFSTEKLHRIKSRILLKNQEIFMELPMSKESFRIGNMGEAYLEFIMSKYCFMHKIVGYKDMGIDYLCEWLNGNAPSRILFGIQVKTTERDDYKIDPKGGSSELSGLEIFSIKPLPFKKIELKTVEYWKGFNIPLYLFVVKKDDDEFNCYYSRLTPILHKNKSVDELWEKIKNADFYKASEKSNFKLITKRNGRDGGFARDLFIDSVRCAYQNGSTYYKDAKEFGLNKWPENDAVYIDLLTEKETEYKDKLKKGLSLLEREGLITVNHNFDSILDELLKKELEKFSHTKNNEEVN